jgi:hypothetical protein
MESVRGSLFQSFFVFVNLSFSLFFSSFCRFSCNLLVLQLSHLLDGILELFFGFWPSRCVSWSLGFEI